MRLMAMLLLFSCATQVPLKYKYSSSKRYLASLTSEDVVVSKIEGELKNPEIFASGMDSTVLIVKLYDESGNVITEVDPNDLTLSTSEDIEAKPFVRKQGVYKAELLPRVKSKSVRMRVDWQEKVMSPEIVLKTTVAPLKNELLPVVHEYFENKSLGEISVKRGGGTPENLTDGFEFSNMGDNRIVDTKKSPSASREFSFEYLEQARQNLALEIHDYPTDFDSHSLHSHFMFFPRKQMFVVEQLTGTIDVTLPTGEKMIFQKDSKEVVGGVMPEGPIDLVTKERNKRAYPDFRYQGKGVVLRANARGQSPQLGQYEVNKIDLEFGLVGSVDVLIIDGQSGKRCRRPKADFWEPIDVSPVEFKFPTDEEFDAYLKKNCGFGLPKL